jgi:hypothetical protein
MKKLSLFITFWVCAWDSTAQSLAREHTGDSLALFSPCVLSPPREGILRV